MTSLPAVITGASRGLGAAFAQTLSQHFHIVAVGRTIGALEALDDRIQAQNGTATLCPIDITDKGAIEALCQAITARWGGIGLWVHTAIYAPALSPAAHIEQADFTKAFKTNVTATQNLIAGFAPLMESPESRAVFFEDEGAHGAFWGAYGASKAAQITLAQSWAQEAQKIGPRVIVLTPRPIASATRAQFYPGEARGALAHPDDEALRLLPQILSPKSGQE